jgi:hypothetical protein
MSIPYLPSLKCTPPHVLLISLSHNVADQLFFISSYYVSILSQPCSPRLLCNVYHSTYSSHLFSSSHNVADQLSFISSYYVSILSQPCSPHISACLPLHMFVWSLHPIMLLTSSSSLHIMCPYYLSLAPLIYSAMSTTLHIRLISSLHPIMSLISSPSSLHIMCPYYLSLAPLIYSAMSTTLHVLVIS